MDPNCPMMLYCDDNPANRNKCKPPGCRPRLPGDDGYGITGMDANCPWADYCQDNPNNRCVPPPGGRCRPRLPGESGYGVTGEDPNCPMALYCDDNPNNKKCKPPGCRPREPGDPGYGITGMDANCPVEPYCDDNPFQCKPPGCRSRQPGQLGYGVTGMDENCPMARYCDDYEMFMNDRRRRTGVDDDDERACFPPGCRPRQPGQPGYGITGMDSNCECEEYTFAVQVRQVRALQLGVCADYCQDNPLNKCRDNHPGGCKTLLPGQDGYGVTGRDPACPMATYCDDNPDNLPHHHPAGYGPHGYTHRTTRLRRRSVVELAVADVEHSRSIRAARWNGIANAEVLSAGLIHAGFSTFIQPIYCFAWKSNADGDEIAQFLAMLPEQYIVPGSTALSTFDERVFAAKYDESVDTRTHALIAFGRIEDVTWVQKVRTQTKRPMVILGVMRDVLAHRVQLFYSDNERRQMAERSSTTFVRAMLHSWMQSNEYVRETQLEYLYSLNATLRNLPIDDVWRARNVSAIASGVDARSTVSPLASVYVGPVGDPQNVRRTLCVFAHSTSLPIPWMRYETALESSSATVPSKFLANVDEDVMVALLAREQREFYYVARALDAFEAFAEEYGCLEQPTEAALREPKYGAGPLTPNTATVTASDAIGNVSSITAITAISPIATWAGAGDGNKTKLFNVTASSDYPLYYFHHVPKTGGTTLSDYLGMLPGKYIVPGSQRSAGFDEDEFRLAEDEVAARGNVIIAFSHMQVRAFVDIIRPSKLANRKIEVIFMIRDVLPHRVSFFHEMIGPEAHDHDQADLDMGKTLARPYPDFYTWASKDTDPATANSSWLTNRSGGTVADFAPVATAECLKNQNCRNPKMDSFQLRAIYKLNFAWSNVPIQEMHTQLHAEEPLDSCERWQSDNTQDNEVLFRHCPNATADVGLALIGHMSLMRETLCLIDRMLGVPVPWSGVAHQGMNWRFKKLRPMDAESSFNSSSANELLSREPRELIFNSMTKSKLMEEAAVYDCGPPPKPSTVKPSTLLPPWTSGWDRSWSEKARQIRTVKTMQIPTALGPASTCTDDPLVTCAKWAKSGECEKMPVFMHAKCAFSCGCPAATSAAVPPAAVVVTPSSPTLPTPTWPTTVDAPTLTAPIAPATADVGSPTENDSASLPCMDDASFPCAAWAKSGECDHIPVFMHAKCAFSCGCPAAPAADEPPAAVVLTPPTLISPTPTSPTTVNEPTLTVPDTAAPEDGLAFHHWHPDSDAAAPVAGQRPWQHQAETMPDVEISCGEDSVGSMQEVDLAEEIDPADANTVTKAPADGWGNDALLSRCDPESCLVMTTRCSLRPECQGCGSICFGDSTTEDAWRTWALDGLAAGLSVYGTDPITNVKQGNRSMWRNVNLALRWSQFEPKPDEFDWSAFDTLLLDVTKSRHSHLPFAVGITFLSGPNYYPQWLFEAPFEVSKYFEVCKKRRDPLDLTDTRPFTTWATCDEVDYAVPNFHHPNYLSRYKRAHEALAAKLNDMRMVNSELRILYMQASLGAGYENTPVTFNPNRTEADYIWTDEEGKPSAVDARWNRCGNCGFDAFAPPRDESLDLFWCPSGATRTGLVVSRRPEFEQFAKNMTAFLYNSVYASHIEDGWLRMMVTSDEPKTWVNLANGKNSASQTEKRMDEMQLFSNGWLDEYAPGSWLMRNSEGEGGGLSGERTRVVHSMLNIFRVTDNGPVRARADLDKFWCWTGEEGNRGQLGAGPVAPSCLVQNWHLYAATMWALTIRIDYWNIPLTVSKDFLTYPSPFDGVWRFLNRYTSIRYAWQSPGAWIGFRDGLDTLDVERFPEAEYGALPRGWQTMSLRNSQSSESQVLLANRQASICRSFEATGCRNEIDPSTPEGKVALDYGNGTNDVNLDVWRSDYGMFMQRRDTPESEGYWWQGPTDQMYGRYSRGFARPQATIELTLDPGLWGGLPLTEERDLILRVVFLDTSIGQFYVGYDALDGPRGWIVETTGTSRWREITYAVTDGRFARTDGGGPNGADIWLRDMSPCVTFTDPKCAQKPTLFDSLEVVEVSRDQSVVDPEYVAEEDHHFVLAIPALPQLYSSTPCHWGHDDPTVSCAIWAKRGECDRIPSFMHTSCAESCGCPAPTNPFSRLISSKPTPDFYEHLAADKAASDKAAADKAAADKAAADDAHPAPLGAPTSGSPIFSPIASVPAGPLADAPNVPCAQWAARGECERMPVFMNSKCALSCKDPNGASLFAPGSKLPPTKFAKPTPTLPASLDAPTSTEPQHSPAPAATEPQYSPAPTAVSSPRKVEGPTSTEPQHSPAPAATEPQHSPAPTAVSSPRKVEGPTSTEPQHSPAPTAVSSPTTACTDAKDMPCAAWAQKGECQRIPVFMHATCALSCGCPAPASSAELLRRDPAMLEALVPSRRRLSRLWKQTGALNTALVP